MGIGRIVLRVNDFPPTNFDFCSGICKFAIYANFLISEVI